MREETKVYKIFKFEELSEVAKNKARDEYRRGLDEDFEPYSEMISESFQEQLEKLGYPTKDVEWRLSYCQGDGVAFYGKIDYDMMDKLVKHFHDEGWLSAEEYSLYKKISNDFSVWGTIERNSYGYHYSHFNTMSVSVESDDIDNIVEELFDLEYGDDRYNEKFDEIEELINKIESCISDEIKDLSREFEKEGYETIEYYHSNEAIDENLIVNEYEYLENGVMYY